VVLQIHLYFEVRSRREIPPTTAGLHCLLATSLVYENFSMNTSFISKAGVVAVLVKVFLKDRQR
jgi:hypothetical protein